MLLFVENIFAVKVEEDGEYCFLSGFIFTRDKSKEKLGVVSRPVPKKARKKNAAANLVWALDRFVSTTSISSIYQLGV